MGKDEETGQKILIAATQLFQQKGLKKTTMDDIAKSVGMGKSSLYYYYKNKEDVFDQVMLHELDKVRDAVTREMSNQSDPEKLLVTYATVYFEELIPRKNLYRIINEEEKDSRARDWLRKIIQDETDKISELIQVGIEMGVVKRIAPDQVKTLANIAVTSLLGIIHYAFEVREDENDARFKEMINLLILRLF